MAENYNTTALKKLKPLFINGHRFLVVQGGMRAGKTYPILMLIISWCQINADKIASVASMSYPHLMRGAIRDFQNIMKAADIWEPERWNSTSKIYTFANGTILEFISVDKMDAHGPARDLLFVNEANDMDRETFEQLASRTTGKVIIDYNPTCEFWAHTWLIKEYANNLDFIILTYKDNEALAPSIREYIESKRPKKGEKPSNWWIVYGLGLVGSLEGNIYTGWQKATPADYDHAKIIRYGLDFGFSNDETALVAIYQTEDDRLIIQELLYKTDIRPSQYAAELKAAGVDPNVVIIADSARPEIIAEIRDHGYQIAPADKNPGSVLRGIDRVKEAQIIYDGKNLEREYFSYAWRKKRTGETIDAPQDGNDHLMDALRYAIDDTQNFHWAF